MTLCRRAALVLPLLALPAAARAQAPALLRVGSKNFTEQLVAGELWAQALEAAGVARVERRLNLGGTLIAQQALTTGQIDLYPEYTGTGLGVVLKEDTSGTPEQVFARVRDGYRTRFGLDWVAPSGVDNGNVLLVLPATARRYGLSTLSDLARVAPQLTLSAGSEFADRADGLPGLKRVYGMEFRRLRQFSALGLRYAALRHGQADVVNGYATDWQIAAGGFVSLRDDKALWPPYQLAAVVRREALDAVPRLAGVLDPVNRRLDNAAMQELNRQVDQDGDEPREVAARFLRAAVLGAASLLYSLPTLALFALLVPLLGLGFWPALVALVTYALPILLRALVAGLAAVPAAVLDAATGMGLTPRQRLWRVEVPLALPALIGGLRVAGVTLVSAATVGALIGAGGLGALILTGLDQGHTEKILVGAALVAALAMALDQALAALHRRLPAARAQAGA